MSTITILPTISHSFAFQPPLPHKISKQKLFSTPVFDVTQHP
jgi:hypothetical protein